MTSYIDPGRDQFEAFKSLPRDVPINMLNLIQLHETARYPDGQACTGREAYQRYGESSGSVFSRVGGTIVWRGEPQVVLIGPTDEQWDLAFIARYPNAAAFLEMVTDPEYQAAVMHRQAAVATSRLIRLADAMSGSQFG